jgi:hypothetical protein
MKILKLKKYHDLFAYSVGDVFQVNDKDTDLLLKGEFAVEASKEEREAFMDSVETGESQGHAHAEKAGKGKK